VKAKEKSEKESCVLSVEEIRNLDDLFFFPFRFPFFTKSSSAHLALKHRTSH